MTFYFINIRQDKCKGGHYNRPQPQASDGLKFFFPSSFLANPTISTTHAKNTHLFAIHSGASGQFRHTRENILTRTKIWNS